MGSCLAPPGAHRPDSLIRANSAVWARGWGTSTPPAVTATVGLRRPTHRGERLSRCRRQPGHDRPTGGRQFCRQPTGNVQSVTPWHCGLRRCRPTSAPAGARRPCRSPTTAGAALRPGRPTVSASRGGRASADPSPSSPRSPRNSNAVATSSGPGRSTCARSATVHAIRRTRSWARRLHRSVRRGAPVRPPLPRKAPGAGQRGRGDPAVHADTKGPSAVPPEPGRRSPLGRRRSVRRAHRPRVVEAQPQIHPIQQRRRQSAVIAAPFRGGALTPAIVTAGTGVGGQHQLEGSGQTFGDAGPRDTHRAFFEG